MQLPQKLLIRQKHSFIELRKVLFLFDNEQKLENKTRIGKVVDTTPLLSRLLHVLVSNSWLPLSFAVYDDKNQFLGSLRKQWGPTSGFSIFDKDSIKIASALTVNKFSSDFSVESAFGWKIRVTKNGFDYLISFPKSVTPLIIKRTPRNLLIRVLYPHIEYSIDLKLVPQKYLDDPSFIIFVTTLPMAMKALGE